MTTTIRFNRDYQVWHYTDIIDAADDLAASLVRQGIAYPCPIPDSYRSSLVTRVVFQRAHGAYQGGETAGFPAAQAAALVASGVAVAVAVAMQYTYAAPYTPDSAHYTLVKLGTGN